MIDRQALPPVPVELVPPIIGDPLERVVADLWAELLGVTVVGPDDDFSARAADALVVEELLTRTEERFGVRLTSADLSEAPTLTAFTHRIRNAERSLPRHPTALALMPPGGRRGVFYFAGAGGLALAFRPVARRITGRAAHAFQSPGLVGRALPLRSVPALARRHLETLRLLQPSGPYVLAGHSLGGLVALEVATMLQAAGEEVGLVVLLDTFLPQRARELATPALPLPYSGAAPAGAGRAPESVAARLRRGVGQVAAGRVPWMVQDLAMRACLPAAGVVQFRGRMHFDLMFEQGATAARRHTVKPYDGRILLVLAEGNLDGADAWAPYLRGPRDVVTLAAEHNSMLRDPYAEIVARVIEQTLDEVGL